MSHPAPTPIFRITHVDNLEVHLKRLGLHAPNHTPADELSYRTIHNVEIQLERRGRRIRCGPGGVIHDYVSFYFGPRSPMLYQLHTGRVKDYNEGQEPIIYLVSTAQDVEQSKAGFVFSDGHGIAAYTTWYADLADLNKIDWKAVYAARWKDDVEDMDRQRRKQAEFLVLRFCDWSLINEIGVVNDRMKAKVEGVMGRYPPALSRSVRVRSEWYY